MIIWRSAQDAYLRDGFAAGLSATQIAEQLKVTRNAICGRKFRLGIRSPNKVGRPFTDDDIATITAMYAARKPVATIARLLNRSEASIYVKAQCLGITREYRRRHG